LTEWPADWPDDFYGAGENLRTHKNEVTPGGLLSRDEEYLHTLARSVYERRLKLGVAKEQARKDLPLSNYTELYWKCDLHNIFHFLHLRLDPHAQKEIREYAHVMACITKVVVPEAFEAFVDYRVGASIFTRLDHKLLSVILANPGLHTHEQLGELATGFGMSKREFDEFCHKINRNTDVPEFDWQKLPLYDRKSGDS
jgi:thymidylate synthase (FAD)